MRRRAHLPRPVGAQVDPDRSRLARIPGWHRLSARFNAAATEVSVDGKLLAGGKGPVGPLISLGIGSSGKAPDLGKAGLDEACFHFDDLQLVRFMEPPNSVEIDPSQDETRLSVGDQLFGTIERADADRVSMTVDTRKVVIPWSEVNGIFPRRGSVPGVPVAGLLARVEWHPGQPTDGREPDFAEGALAEVTESTLALATPYAGTLRIPRSRVRSIRVTGRGRRSVLDTASHHLGDSISVEAPLLDPPLPEGTTLERTFELPGPVDGPAFLVLDVLQVVGEEPGLPFSEFIRKGELRTYILLGGKRVDYLNRHVETRNETVERIRIPLPAGRLVAGKNVIRIEQTASADDPTGFDDLGILQMALEIDSPPAGPAAEPPKPNARETP